VRVADEADDSTVAEAQSQAEQLYQQIDSEGAEFAAVLEANRTQPHIEGGDLGIIEPGLMDPSFEDALFALDEVGSVTPPVRTRFGFHIIRLDDIRAGQTPALDEVREELERDLRMTRAERQFFNAAETLANITFEQPDSLFPAAEMLDLPLHESDWMDRSSRSGIARHEQVRDAAFSPDVLLDRLNSPALEIEPGHVVVVRVADHQPADTLALEAVREQIVEILRDQYATERLQLELEEALAMAREGTSLQTLAETTGTILRQPGSVTRTADDVDPVLLDTVFQLTPPQSGAVRYAVSELSAGDQALLALHEVTPGAATPEDSAALAELRDQLGFRTGDEQFRNFIGHHREQLNIRIRESRLQ
jgi:peptidyl-prolyl cis-trans isomerase D